MPASRLTTAFDQGLLGPSVNSIRVVRPPLDYDLSALEPDNLQIDTGFKPDADAFANAGYTLGNNKADVSIVVIPRSKVFARALVAQAAVHSNLVVVDGQKTNGVDSIFKEVRKRIGDLPSVTKAHGRLFAFSGGSKFDDWLISGPTKGDHGYWTNAGTFSDGAVDRGSMQLLAAIPDTLKGRIADFGAGCGYLSVGILKLAGVGSVDLLEAEALSLECARLNVTDNRAVFHWCDVTQFKSSVVYDTIVMNICLDSYSLD